MGVLGSDVNRGSGPVFVVSPVVVFAANGGGVPPGGPMVMGEKLTRCFSAGAPFAGSGGGRAGFFEPSGVLRGGGLAKDESVTMLFPS